MTFSREQVERVYDEMERRLAPLISTGILKTDKEIKDCRSDMLQGVYGTLMVLADNWTEVRRWADRIEEERFYSESPLTLMAIED